MSAVKCFFFLVGSEKKCYTMARSNEHRKNLGCIMPGVFCYCFKNCVLPLLEGWDLEEKNWFSPWLKGWD